MNDYAETRGSQSSTITTIITETIITPITWKIITTTITKTTITTVATPTTRLYKCLKAFRNSAIQAFHSCVHMQTHILEISLREIWPSIDGLDAYTLRPYFVVYTLYMLNEDMK